MAGGSTTFPPLRLYPINQFSIYDLHSLVPNAIDHADPLHLVVCLELLCDTFRLGHLLYQPKKHFLRLTVDIGKVAVQFSAGEQGRIACPAMLLQVTPMALSPHADGLLLFFGQFQIREKVISDLCVSAAHFLKNCLSYFVLPSKFVYLQYEFSRL